MKYFINYADKNYIESQKLSTKYAKDFCFICKEYNRNDLDLKFSEENKEILSFDRGAGYWLWKPYIILKTLNEINYGDYLVYMDSGAYIEKSIDNFLHMIGDKGILSFSLIHKQSKYTKGDCFHVLNPIKDPYKYKDCNQILASFIFLKKTEYSLNFIKKWLYYCKDKNLITDCENVYMNNLSDFIDHRHDQSILSMLCYNNNIPNLPDISQYSTEHGLNNDWIYINHHRNKN